MLLGFSNSSGDEYLRFPFVPSTTLIAEGELTFHMSIGNYASSEMHYVELYLVVH